MRYISISFIVLTISLVPAVAYAQPYYSCGIVTTQQVGSTSRFLEQYTYVYQTSPSHYRVRVVSIDDVRQPYSPFIAAYAAQPATPQQLLTFQPIFVPAVDSSGAILNLRIDTQFAIFTVEISECEELPATPTPVPSPTPYPFPTQTYSFAECESYSGQVTIVTSPTALNGTGSPSSYFRYRVSFPSDDNASYIRPPRYAVVSGSVVVWYETETVLEVRDGVTLVVEQTSDIYTYALVVELIEQCYVDVILPTPFSSVDLEADVRPVSYGLTYLGQTCYVIVPEIDWSFDLPVAGNVSLSYDGVSLCLDRYDLALSYDSLDLIAIVSSVLGVAFAWTIWHLIRRG